MRARRPICILAFSLLAAPLAAGQTIHTVRPQGPGTIAPWDIAVTTLEAALAAAQPGDEIWIAAGNYTPSLQTLTYTIPGGVKIYGGFAGTETNITQRSANVSANPTTLNENSSAVRIVTIGNSSNPILIDRLVVQNAPSRLRPSGTDMRGAGVLATGSTIAFVDCTFRNNHAGGTYAGSQTNSFTGASGGAMALAQCVTTFVRCVFSDNASSAGGGSCALGSPGIAGPSGHGGAIFATGGAASFIECAFANNSAANGAYGIYCMLGNTSGTSGGSGGAIYALGTTLSFKHCQFSGNKAGNGGAGSGISCFAITNGEAGTGGAVYAFASSFEADGCVFQNNQSGNGGGGACGPGKAGGSGGALFLNVQNPPVLSNCLFLGNKAGSGGWAGTSATGSPLSSGNGGGGGAVSVVSSGGAIVNCTFFGNEVGPAGPGTPSGIPGKGAAIAGSDVLATSCILWSNGVSTYERTVDVDSCCIDTQPPGPNGITADPLFINPAAGDFRLQPNSPCINAGKRSAYHGGTVDLDNKPRFVAACSPGLTAIEPRAGLDMGAYEFQFASPDCDADGLCDAREVTGTSIVHPAFPQTGQLFGWALAVSPSLAAVGSRSKTTPQGEGAGEVVAYDRIGPALVSPTSLAPADAAPGDDFGNQVVLAESSSRWLVSGARFADLPNATNAGAAYVFRRDGVSWTLSQKLTSAAPTPNEQFAHGLAIDPATSTLVAGSLHANTAAPDTGAATVFALANNSWSLAATLAASDAASGDGFGISVGISVGISGNTIVIGAPYRQDNGPSSGAAYVFTRSGSTWSQTSKLLPLDGQPGDTFGELVAISGDTILISSPRHRVLSRDHAGAVYVFRQATPGDPWLHTATLTSNQPRAEELFGFALAIDGDAAVIGGFKRSSTLARSGAAYVFRRIGGLAGTWTRAARIDNPEPDTNAFFGYGLALSGSAFLVGAPQQAVATVPAVGAVRAFDLSRLDANAGGTIDSCDIAANPAIDTNQNGIPDSIEPSRCATDANADGALTPSDILAFLTDWFQGSAAADFNGNAQVEIQDIFDYLNAWFAGC